MSLTRLQIETKKTPGTGPKYVHHHRAGILEIDLHRAKMFLEQKQLHVVVVYIICVPLSTENLYTTTAPEIRRMPNLIGNPWQSRIPLGVLVVRNGFLWLCCYQGQCLRNGSLYTTSAPSGILDSLGFPIRLGMRRISGAMVVYKISLLKGTQIIYKEEHQ